MNDDYRDPAARVRLREQAVAWRKVAEETVLLDIATSQYHAINASGTAIWEQLAEGATVGELTAALASKYPQAAERASADVHVFLARLQERGLLEVAEH